MLNVRCLSEEEIDWPRREDRSCCRGDARRGGRQAGVASVGKELLPTRIDPFFPASPRRPTAHRLLLLGCNRPSTGFITAASKASSPTANGRASSSMRHINSLSDVHSYIWYPLLIIMCKINSWFGNYNRLFG